MQECPGNLLEFDQRLCVGTLGEVIRKLKAPGQAYCLLCRKEINYGNKGVTASLDRSQKDISNSIVMVQFGAWIFCVIRSMAQWDYRCGLQTDYILLVSL